MAAKPKKPDKRQELLDAIAAGPPAGGSATSESFVGVPSGYGTLPGVSTPPRYREGYQFTPAGWPSEMVARLQLMLDGAGLYDPDDQPRKGFFDPEIDVKAFKRLLTYSNASGQSFEDAIVQIGSQPRRTKPGAGRARIDITSSEDLRELANRVSKKSIGKSLDPAQLDTFIKAYQGMETSGAAGIPSPEAFLSSKVEQANPKETYARKLVDKFQVFDDIMTGGGLGIQAAQAGQGGGTTGI